MTTKVAGGSVSSVTVVDGTGRPLAGTMRADGTSWVPSRPLEFGRTYTATVVAAATDGRRETRRTTFTTAARRSVPELGSGLYLFTGNTYGVAMPVVAEFVPGVPARDRAAVQRRLFVQSAPSQPGVWHWTASGAQAFYRPPAYWRPGTRIAVRLGLAGLRLSNGRQGTRDRSASITIGRPLSMLVDNRTKMMTVTRDGKVARRIPVSLGKRSTPSSSGTLVVMEKATSTIFDTRAELGPAEGYRTRISYAQRLTWGGEFIHSAPWSVGDQGRRNVSHGCVNIAPGHAAWLFRQTLIGDPVVVRGTETKITDGNGWTAWAMPWQEHIRSSALPVPEPLRSAGQTADVQVAQRVVTSRL
ncbi:Ig-like domain-containing protein [Pilimelia columellifera subsp. columellifera]|uniref:Ig-like domain-containing protein n=1 Tax=Pilimelia columellifera subsp. columellifera TaxID=706583 RepID=A0ABP6AV10_9ACTN